MIWQGKIVLKWSIFLRNDSTILFLPISFFAFVLSVNWGMMGNLWGFLFFSIGILFLGIFIMSKAFQKKKALALVIFLAGISLTAIGCRGLIAAGADMVAGATIVELDQCKVTEMKVLGTHYYLTGEDIMGKTKKYEINNVPYNRYKGKEFSTSIVVWEWCGVIKEIIE